MHKIRDAPPKRLQGRVAEIGITIDHRIAADGLDHLFYFFREPVIILIAERDVFSPRQAAALLKIADKPQVALVDLHPHPRIAAGILPQDPDGSVPAAIIVRDDLECRISLRQYRTKLFMQIRFAVIGTQYNRY